MPKIGTTEAKKECDGSVSAACNSKAVRRPRVRRATVPEKAKKQTNLGSAAEDGLARQGAVVGRE